MRQLLCVWLLMLCTAQCYAQMQAVYDSAIVVNEDVMIKQFKYRGEDSGYVIKDSIIVGYISRRTSTMSRSDMGRNFQIGYRKNFDRLYYYIYNRDNKVVAMIERQQQKSKRFDVMITVYNSTKMFSFKNTTEEKVLPTALKMLLADNVLW